MKFKFFIQLSINSCYTDRGCPYYPEMAAMAPGTQVAHALASKIHWRPQRRRTTGVKSTHGSTWWSRRRQNVSGPAEGRQGSWTSLTWRSSGRTGTPLGTGSRELRRTHLRTAATGAYLEYQIPGMSWFMLNFWSDSIKCANNKGK